MATEEANQTGASVTSLETQLESCKLEGGEGAAVRNGAEERVENYAAQFFPAPADANADADATADGAADLESQWRADLESQQDVSKRSAEFSSKTRRRGRGGVVVPSATTGRKFFIGGLSHQTNASHLRNYFGQFGELADVVVMFEGRGRKPRGFGFVTFVEQAPVREVLKSRFHNVNGRDVDVKLAVPRENMDPSISPAGRRPGGWNSPKAHQRVLMQQQGMLTPAMMTGAAGALPGAPHYYVDPSVLYMQPELAGDLGGGLHYAPRFPPQSWGGHRTYVPSGIPANYASANGAHRSGPPTNYTTPANYTPAANYTAGGTHATANGAYGAPGAYAAFSAPGGYAPEYGEAGYDANGVVPPGSLPAAGFEPGTALWEVGPHPVVAVVPPAVPLAVVPPAVPVAVVPPAVPVAVMPPAMPVALVPHPAVAEPEADPVQPQD